MLLPLVVGARGDVSVAPYVVASASGGDAANGDAIASCDVAFAGDDVA